MPTQGAPASDLPPPELTAAAARAVQTARARFGVRRAALFWRPAGGEALICIASAAESGAEGWLGRALAPGVGVAGRAVAEGRAVWSPDLLADPRVPLAPWLRERLEQESLRSVAAAPLPVGGVARGALGLLDRAGRTFDDAELGALERLGEEVARDLQRAVAPGR